MKWIKYAKDFDGRKSGEMVSEDDRAADVLIKTAQAVTPTADEIGIAEKAVKDAAAATVVEPDAVRKMVEEVVGATIAKLPAQGKRFTDPVKDEPDNGYVINTAEVKRVNASARRVGRLKNFANTDEGRYEAYRFGHWFAGVVARTIPGYQHLEWGAKYCQQHGLGFQQDIDAKGNVTNNNAAGGFLVPIEFDNVLIDLRERYGVARQNMNVTPMASDVKFVPRRKSGLTASFVGEATAGSESTKNWDQVQLVAKKIMALTRYSNEIGEDAIINIGDDLAGEIAYAFALLEDQCAFVGDGTSKYGGITGMTNKLLGVDATPANILGLQIGAAGTGAAWSGFALSDFNAVVGKLPEYADSPNAKWYVSKTFWGTVMQKIATAAGGNKVSDIVDGARIKEFLGYEVVVAQVMPKVAAVNQVVALFGDISMGASFGDRRMSSIKVSDSALNAFEQDQLIIRGTERFDIVVHDVGESIAGTARDPSQGLLAGPICGLSTASS